MIATFEIVKNDETFSRTKRKGNQSWPACLKNEKQAAHSALVSSPQSRLTCCRMNCWMCCTVTVVGTPRWPLGWMICTGVPMLGPAPACPLPTLPEAWMRCAHDSDFTSVGLPPTAAGACFARKMAVIWALEPDACPRTFGLPVVTSRAWPGRDEKQLRWRLWLRPKICSDTRPEDSVHKPPLPFPPKEYSKW